MIEHPRRRTRKQNAEGIRAEVPWWPGEIVIVRDPDPSCPVVALAMRPRGGIAHRGCGRTAGAALSDLRLAIEASRAANPMARMWRHYGG